MRQLQRSLKAPLGLLAHNTLLPAPRLLHSTYLVTGSNYYSASSGFICPARGQRGSVAANSSLSAENSASSSLLENARRIDSSRYSSTSGATTTTTTAQHKEDVVTLSAAEILSNPTILTGCEPNCKKLRVAVLLSGGVDSSVALNLVKAAGHEVTAFYLQIWFQEDFRNFWDQCPWEEDLAVCKAVCEQAGVPLEVVPLTTHYWDRVVSHSIQEIRSGRTPNPDMLCNSRVKFGAFLEYLDEQKAGMFDRVASGHYARVTRRLPAAAGQEEVAALQLTRDDVKDQTYFLAHLSQRQLARCMFPLGPLTKPEVRAVAAALDLPNKARKDSQGICFLGKVKFPEFVKEHLGEWPGVFIDQDTGKLAGYHSGFWFYTVGQRQGIKLSGGPWYVVKKDIDQNIVYVSRSYHQSEEDRRRFRCGAFSWGSGRTPSDAADLRVKVRHGPHRYSCRFQWEEGSGQRSAVVALDGADQGLAAGQYAVFYDGEECLGCGTIL